MFAEIEQLSNQVASLENQLRSTQDREKMLQADLKAARDLCLKLETNLDNTRLNASSSDSMKNKVSFYCVHSWFEGFRYITDSFFLPASSRKRRTAVPSWDLGSPAWSRDRKQKEIGGPLGEDAGEGIPGRGNDKFTQVWKRESDRTACLSSKSNVIYLL